jgi:hypothetical protein
MQTPGIDPVGLENDRDVVALYGDPAYDARIKPCTGAEPVYDQTITYAEITPGHYEFTMTVHLNKPINISKPVIAFLPFQISDVTILNYNARVVEITDDMAMMQLWAQGDPDLQVGQEWQLVFVAKRLGRWSKPPVAGDINRDGVVNMVDFAILSAHWLEVTTP